MHKTVVTAKLSLSTLDFLLESLFLLAQHGEQRLELIRRFGSRGRCAVQQEARNITELFSHQRGWGERTR